MEFGCVSNSLWGFPFSWLPVRHVHWSNPRTFLYLALLDCLSKPNLKFHHLPSLCPLVLTCKKAHDSPQHLSKGLTGQEDEENSLFCPRFNMCMVDSGDVLYFCQQARNQRHGWADFSRAVVSKASCNFANLFAKSKGFKNSWIRLHKSWSSMCQSHSAASATCLVSKQLSALLPSPRLK